MSAELDTFATRLSDLSDKFYEASQYGSPRAMQDLRDAMRRVAQKSGGDHFMSFYRGFAREVESASALTTELGRAKRLRDKASHYFHRLSDGHQQDQPKN